MDTCEIVCFDLKWEINGPLIYGEPSVNATMGTGGGNVCQIHVCILLSDICKNEHKTLWYVSISYGPFFHYKTFIFA